MKMHDEVESNRRWAHKLWEGISPISLAALKKISADHYFSIPMGDLLYLEKNGMSHTSVCCALLSVRRAPEYVFSLFVNSPIPQRPIGYSEQQSTSLETARDS